MRKDFGEGVSMSAKNKRHKILIVDDSEMNRSILADMLGDEYEIIEAVDGEEAVARLNMNSTDISLMLLDVVMPNMDGFEVLAIMNKRNWIKDIPVIMISAENASSYVGRAYELGVTDYISRPFDGLVVHRRVINTIMLYAKQKKLMGLVADQIYEKEKSNKLMVSILSHIVEFRNGESGLHVLHINIMTEILLNKLIEKTDRYNLKRSDVSVISIASSLHDIGKISIPEAILNKPGRLTKEEFEIMKTHSVIGAEMLDQLPYYKNEELVKVAYQICRWHHERYDGRGYPDGLKGEDIPIAAQVVALADVYDALTSVRIYKPAYSHEKALEMIMNGECGTFNPLLIECLLEVGENIREELEVSSIKKESNKEIHGVMEELLHHEELSASERTLKLLEHERMKNQFFASLTQDIQFEYTKDPSMLTLSETGAQMLNVKEITMNPMEDPEFLQIFGKKIVKDMEELIHKTTCSEPLVQYDMEMRIRGEKRWCRIYCRSIWSSEETPVMTGCIGKIVDIHKEHMQINYLRRQAAHDGLTGLLNHKTAERLIRKKIDECEDQNYIIAIFDIDYFKEANDRYGHMFGDKVLQYIAEKLISGTRCSDITARVGGDEFLVFLEDKEGVEEAVDRIFHLLSGNYQGFKIHVSMGIAKTADVGREYTTVFHCADRALYRAKNDGRSRYCFYDESMKDMLSVISDIDKES